MLDFCQQEYSGFRNQDFGSHLIMDGPKVPVQVTLSMHVPRGPLALKMSPEVTAVTPTPSVSSSLPASGKKKVQGFPRVPWVAETPDTHLPTPRLHCEPEALKGFARGGIMLIALGPAGPPEDEKWWPSPSALLHNGDQVPASCHALHPRSLEPGALPPPGQSIKLPERSILCCNPKSPGKAASQAARRGTPASMDFTRRIMVRAPSNTLLG